MQNELFDFVNDYEQFLNYLFKLKSNNLDDFNKKLIQSKYEIIGVPIPALRDLSKKISRTNYREYLNCCKFKYFEEVMIFGFVISYANVCENERIQLLENFVKYIDNWAINDCVACTLKCINVNKDLYFNYILSLCNSESVWKIRFGLILLMNYYLCDEYIDKVINIILSNKNPYYYVMMARSWLIATMFVKYRERAINLLKSKVLDKQTQNKAIQKIKESYRVTSQDKLLVQTFKI